MQLIFGEESVDSSARNDAASRRTYSNPQGVDEQTRGSYLIWENNRSDCCQVRSVKNIIPRCMEGGSEGVDSPASG
jgi:hypothetical protein